MTVGEILISIFQDITKISNDITHYSDKNDIALYLNSTTFTLALINSNISKLENVGDFIESEITNTSKEDKDTLDLKNIIATTLNTLKNLKANINNHNNELIIHYNNILKNQLIEIDSME